MENDIRQLFTPETIGILLTLLSMPLTNVLKRIWGTEGNYTRLVNVFINALKGAVVMVIGGQSSFTYALVWLVVGVLVDQATYFAVVKPEKAKV